MSQYNSTVVSGEGEGETTVPDIDILGAARPQGDGVDMGASEYTQEAVLNASFVISQSSGAAPLTVHCTDTSTTKNVSDTHWSWVLGNETSFERNPTVTFTEAGTYDVVLMVTTAEGMDFAVQEGAITVTDSGDPTDPGDPTEPTIGCFGGCLGVMGGGRHFPADCVVFALVIGVLLVWVKGRRLAAS